MSEETADEAPGEGLGAYLGGLMGPLKALEAQGAEFFTDGYDGATSAQGYATEQDRLERDNPGMAAGGAATRTAASFLLPAVKLVGSASLAAKGVVGALAAGAASGAFQSGDIAHQMQLDATPITIEGIMQELDHSAMTEAMLLGSVVGPLSSGLSQAGLSAWMAKNTKGAPSVLQKFFAKYPAARTRSVKAAAAHAASAATGAPAGLVSIIADTVASSQTIKKAAQRTSNIALSMTEALGAKIDRNVDSFVQGTSLAVASFTRKDLNKEYSETASLLESAQTDPQGYAAHLRSQLNELPEPVADGVTAKALQNNALLYPHLPKNPMPPSATYNEWEPSDHEKRKFLAKVDAVRDPVYGFLYGTPETQKLAADAYPETVNQFRGKLMERLSGEKVPYKVRLKIARALGMPVVPSQDPLIGAKLQGIYQEQAMQQAQSAGEGGGSARQIRAQQMKDKTVKQWYTMGQSLMEVDEK